MQIRLTGETLNFFDVKRPDSITPTSQEATHLSTSRCAYQNWTLRVRHHLNFLSREPRMDFQSFATPTNFFCKCRWNDLEVFSMRTSLIFQVFFKIFRLQIFSKAMKLKEYQVVCRGFTFQNQKYCGFYYFQQIIKHMLPHFCYLECFIVSKLHHYAIFFPNLATVLQYFSSIRHYG